MKSPLDGGLVVFGVRFWTLKTVRHYFALGCYLGVFFALVAIARALPDLPGKLRGTTFSFVDMALGIVVVLLVFALIVLLGGLLGGLAGRLRLDAEERARARDESLIVRR